MDLQLHELVVQNLPFAHCYARRVSYRFPEIPLDDLTQLACLGLCRAAEKYDPERGVFLACAQWHIRDAIGHEFGHWLTIRLPHWITQKRRYLSRKRQAHAERGRAIRASPLGSRSVAGPDAEPWRIVEERQERAEVAAWLESLGAEDRAVVDAVYKTGPVRQTRREVGRGLGVDQATVYNRCRRLVRGAKMRVDCAG